MNGHGIYVWIVVAIVTCDLVCSFIYYKIKIKRLKKKLDESN